MSWNGEKACIYTSAVILCMRDQNKMFLDDKVILDQENVIL